MKIELNKNDLSLLDNIMNQKDMNFTVSSSINSYLNEHYDEIGKKAVDEIMSSEGLDENTSLEEAFYRFLQLDSQDPLVTEMRERTDFGVFTLIDNKEFIEHPFNQIRLDSIQISGFKLFYNYFEPYELFNYDETYVDKTKDYAEINKLGYFNKKVPYLALEQNGSIWMSITPHEFNTMREAIKKAHGKVITFGLGLGYYAFEASNKEDVDEVIIIEKNHVVINLFNRYILPHFPNKDKIKIIHIDAFKYFDREMAEEHFDYAYVDIYHTPEDALPLYIRFKKLESKHNYQNVNYWIEKSILCYYRRYVLTIIEEYFQGYKNEDYIDYDDDESKIINQTYDALKDMEIHSIDEIKALLNDEALKEIITKLK